MEKRLTRHYFLHDHALNLPGSGTVRESHILFRPPAITLARRLSIAEIPVLATWLGSIIRVRRTKVLL